MTRLQRCNRKRKAAWLGFFIVALASLAAGRDDGITTALSTTSTAQPSLNSAVSADVTGTNTPEFDPQSAASRAYKQALQTLSTLVPLQHTRGYLDMQQHSMFASLLPNQPGPISSAIRILFKLRQQSWMPSFLNPGVGSGSWGTKKREEMRGKAVKVLDLLGYAVELGNTDALYKLAQVSLFPPHPLLRNISRAFDAYLNHASLTGSSSSHSILGFFYSTGYGDLLEVDQAKALLHYTFAAHGGDAGAQMALGYRYWAGIGVNDDCMQALDWYQAAAEHSMAKFLSGPPGGRTLPLLPTKLSDLDGGVYGRGASAASTGLMSSRAVITAASARQAGETWDDVLDYYIFNAERGEMSHAYRLGKIFYRGSMYPIGGEAGSLAEGFGAVPRDFQYARAYFRSVARTVWPNDAPTAKKEVGEDKPLGFAVAAAGYLGRMYLRGEGVKADPKMAKLWFDRGAEHGNSECLNGLGIIWRDGLIDGKKDLKKAVSYFTVAASHEHSEAQVNLGKHYYQKGDMKLATTYFDNAMRLGNPFEAYYYLAEIYATTAQNAATLPHMASSSCGMAVSFYKVVAERGSWSEDHVRDGETIWNTGMEGSKEDAILRWWVAAERGIEMAQNNLAYVFDQDKSILRTTRFAPYTPSNDTARLALTQWTRSAAQGDVDALVKVGDYYYHGLGVPDMPDAERLEKAAAFYQSASDTQMSAMAAWNLGWMYENGIGVPQDFHLAKRHYDMALDTNHEAYLPATLSLIKLHIRSIWYTLMGGKNGLTLWSDEAARSRREPQELEGGHEGDDEVQEEREGDFDDYEDDQWYMGRARDEHNKRLRNLDANRLARGQDDPAQWPRDQRNGDNEREGDYGSEEFPSIRGQRRGEEGVGEDEFAETLLLVGLCLAVSLLIWVRGRWVERRRREEPEFGGGPAPGQNGRPFPPPAGQARNGW